MTIGLNKETTTCSGDSKNSYASITPSAQPHTIPHRSTQAFLYENHCWNSRMVAGKKIFRAVSLLLAFFVAISQHTISCGILIQPDSH